MHFFYHTYKLKHADNAFLLRTNKVYESRTWRTGELIFAAHYDYISSALNIPIDTKVTATARMCAWIPYMFFFSLDPVRCSYTNIM